MELKRSDGLKGEIRVPGDKSISHRSIMLGAISEGTTRVRGFLKSEDCLSTIGCFKAMGVDISEEEGEIIIRGAGLKGLKAPGQDLYCGNSGTTARIISGILSGQDFSSTLTGDPSLSKRPMKRVIEPLSTIGALIRSDNEAMTLPLHIAPSHIHGGEIKIDVASAQVKSALLMAGLYADSPLRVREPSLSRNHTEIMLRAFGADIRPGSFEDTECVITPGNTLRGMDITVPGDISSAAFFIGAALITPGSEILIKNVGVNGTRDGILRVFKDMGADISLINTHTEGGEDTADIVVRYSSLKGTVIEKDVIPALIDELPLIAVAATQAEGTTVIRDASELKVKESDRIELMTRGLKDMGADITGTDDGFIINGPAHLKGAEIFTAKDHRIAMSFAVAALINSSDTPVTLDHPECVGISYPSFYEDLSSLSC